MLVKLILGTSVIKGVRISKQVVMAATDEQGVTHGYP